MNWAGFLDQMDSGAWMKVCGGRVTMVPSTRISRLHCILALELLIATSQGIQNTWRLFMSSLRNSVILTFMPMWPPCPLPNPPPDLPVQMVPGTWKTLKCSLNRIQQMFLNGVFYLQLDVCLLCVLQREHDVDGNSH